MQNKIADAAERGRKAISTPPPDIIFGPAKRKAMLLRMLIGGIPNSGKTFTSLSIARHLVPDGLVCLIDTEGGAAHEYADHSTVDGLKLDYQVYEMQSFEPKAFVRAIQAAEKMQADVIIIDTATKEWNGKSGILRLVDQLTQDSRSGNSFGGWNIATPQHELFVETLMTSTAHIIVTARERVKHKLILNPEKGKYEPQCLGLKPIQREDFGYEFRFCATLDSNHNLIFTKSKAPGLPEGKPFPCAAETVAVALNEYLNSGEPIDAADEMVNMVHRLGYSDDALKRWLEGKYELAFNGHSIRAGINSLMTPEQQEECIHLFTEKSLALGVEKAPVGTEIQA